MKDELNIDELLNSYVDGELTARQETEVRRMIDNDPQIAQRLQQLQKCKMLMSSLPAANAPAQMLDNIKASLETRTPPGKLRPVVEKQVGTRSLLAQRIITVAAMIGLVVVLTAVMYTIAPPDTAPEIIEGMESGPTVVAAKVFRSRLEMKTSDFIAVDAFINRAIEDNSLSESLAPTREPNRRIYSLTCSEQGLNLLLADLRNIWNKLDAATFFIDTEVFGEQVVIETVTAEQITEIISQLESNKYIETAKDIAVLNNMAERMPGREIISAIEVSMDGLITIPKPVLTSKEPKIKEPVPHSEDEQTIQLTIIVNR